MSIIVYPFKKVLKIWKMIWVKRPKSKKKSFLIGFTSTLGIFSFILFSPTLPAYAKDIEFPKKKVQPTDIEPTLTLAPRQLCS